jgi:hypothetical protein
VLKYKFFSLLGALAMAAFLIGGASSARATELNFGASAPSGCATNLVGGDEGYVCYNNQTFTSGGYTFTANGYAADVNMMNVNQPFTTATALTWKSGNGTSESGLGENATPPSDLMGNNNVACTDNPGGGNPSTPCEIGVNASVGITTSAAIITDVQVGSAQSGYEQFQVWTTSDGMTWTQYGGSSNNYTWSTCPNQVSTDLCEIDLTTAVMGVGVVDLAGTPPSDTLVTAVSYNAVPAPPIGRGLPIILSVGGLLFGSWLLDRSKKRRLPGAIGHAAA